MKVLKVIRDTGSIPVAVERLCPEQWQKENFWGELGESEFFQKQINQSLKDYFLMKYPDIRDIEKVCKEMVWIGTSTINPEAVMGWCEEGSEDYDPIFEGKFRRLRNQIEAAQKLKSVELVGPALEVYKQELVNTLKLGANEYQKDRGAKVAGKVLTGKRLLEEAPEVLVDARQDNRSIIVDNLKDPEIRQKLIDLSRSLEGRASGDSGKV